MRKLVRGPGNWCTARDLHLLKDGYHFAKAFPDLRTYALACKMRVYHFEDQAHGGLNVFRRLTAIRATLAGSPWVGRAARWSHWLQGSFLQQLQAARDECASHGIRHQKVLQDLAKTTYQPWTTATWARVRSNYQKEIRR